MLYPEIRCLMVRYMQRQTHLSPPDRNNCLDFSDFHGLEDVMLSLYKWKVNFKLLEKKNCPFQVERRNTSIRDLISSHLHVGQFIISINEKIIIKSVFKDQEKCLYKWFLRPWI